MIVPEGVRKYACTLSVLIRAARTLDNAIECYKRLDHD
jgi:hypothetical protein